MRSVHTSKTRDMLTSGAGICAGFTLAWQANGRLCSMLDVHRSTSVLPRDVG